MIITSDSGFCNFEVEAAEDKGKFQWNETEAGKTAQALCPYGPPEMIAGRLCVSRDMWAAPDVSGCRTVASELFEDLKETLQQVYCSKKKIL